MQVHFFVEQQWPQINKVHSRLFVILQPERILIPSDNLIILLLFLTWDLFQYFQERFVIKEPLFDRFDVLLDL